MNADETSEITRLVALQLEQFAADQSKERQDIYKMIVALTKHIEKVYEAPQMTNGATLKDVTALLGAFSEKFVETIVPKIAAQVASNGTSKSSPAMTEAVSTAIVEGTKAMIRRTVEPLVARIESLESRTPRDR